MDSEWQNGPKFLSLPSNEWPVRSAKELAATARMNIDKLQKKAFVAALTRAKAKKQGMRAEVTMFWRSWSQLAGPNLVVQSKWHTSQRNVAVGDVVWLCDQNALRGQFKLQHQSWQERRCERGEHQDLPKLLHPCNKTSEGKAKPSSEGENPIQATGQGYRTRWHQLC